MRSIVTLAVAFAFMIPVAGATDAPAEAAETGLHLVHDLGANHTAWIGQPYSFGYVLLDAEGMTQVHQQGCIVVEQNGVVLYETTADSSHDYNALNTFQFTFERAGPFTVWVAIPDGACGEGVQYEDELEGVAKRAPATMNVTVELDTAAGSSDVPPRQMTVTALDEAGEPVQDVRALVEIRRPDDGWLALRAPLASSDDPEQPMAFCYEFPEGGEWLVRAIVSDAAEPPRFAPTTATAIADRSNSLVSPSNGGMAALTCPEATDACEPVDGVASTAEDADPVLRTAIDPQASSTPFSRFVLNAVLVDSETAAPTGAPAYEAWIRSSCMEPLFYSSHLASSGPLLDLVFHWPEAGQYEFAATATADGKATSNTLDFTVGEVLPVHGIPMPATVGAVIVTADGLDDFSAGEPGTVTFFSSDASGTAAAHSEIDFQILRSEWGPPLVQNKLHTHASGSFEFGYTFVEPGDYVLVVDPVTIHGEATPDYYYGELGGELVVPFSVADGPGLVDNVTDPVDDTDLEGDSQIPGAGLVALLAAVAVGVALRRRG